MPAASGAIQLQNVAPGCGLDFVLRNDAAGRKYQVETVLGGLAVIDFDHDGWPDLYCVNGAALPSLKKNDPRFYNRLYRNNRNGTFTDVTEHAGVQGNGYEMGAAVGDYNNDGLSDIFMSSGFTAIHSIATMAMAPSPMLRSRRASAASSTGGNSGQWLRPGLIMTTTAASIFSSPIIAIGVRARIRSVAA